MAGLVALVLMSCLALAPGASAASLCTKTWTGPAEGNWRTAANWSTGSVPGSGDVACIGAGHAVNIGEGENQAGVLQGAGALNISGGQLQIMSALEESSIASLTLGNGSLLTSGTLAVSNSLALATNASSTIGGSGRLVLGTAATGTINSARCSRLVLNAVTLLNQGTLTLGASGGAPDGPLWMENGAQLQNAGTFNDDSTEPAGCGYGRLPSIYQSAGTNSILNTGTFQSASSEEPVETNVPFTNQGTVNAQTGTLQLAGGGTGAKGTWSASNGATLAFTGGTFALNNDTFNGAGTIAVTGANVTATSLQSSSSHVSLSGGTLSISEGTTSTLTTLGLTGGTLNLPGALTVTSALAGSGSTTVSGSGKLVLASTSTSTIDSARCSRLVLNAVTLLNQGTLTLGASGGAPDGPLWMENGAQLQNAGTFNDDSTEPSGCGYGHLPSIYQNAGTNSILNTGTFQSASSEEPVETNVPFTNQGTVNAQTGTLQLAGGGTGAKGTWSASNGATLAFTSGTFALNNDTFNGAGTIAVTGATVTATNLTSTSAHVTIANGSLSIPAGSTSTISSGSLLFNASPATLEGSGKLVLAAGATGTINPARCTHLVLNAVTLLNQGTLTLGASGGAPDGPLWMENGAQLQNAGTFNDDSTEPSGCGYGRLPSIYQSAGTNSILNTGTFQSASSEEPVETNVPFTNQGTVNAQTGTLQLAGGGTGAKGTWSASNGATLAFTGGTFALNNDTFNGAGTIAVTGANVTATSLQSSSSHVSLSGGTLSISEGTTSTLTTLGLTGGTLNLPGALTVTSALAGSGSTTVSGSGKLVLASTSTSTIDSARCSRLVLNAVTLLNQGTLTLGASGGAPDGPLWMENGAQLQNAGTFNDDSTEPSGCGYGHLPSIYQNAGTNSILNTGTFQSASSEEPVETNVPFTNQGTVNAQTGTLQLAGGGTGAKGTWSASNGATLAFTSGTFALNNDTFNGAGTIAVTGANVTATNLQSSSAHASLSGGTLSIPASTTSTLTTLGLTGGTLNLPGALTITSALTGGTSSPTVNGSGKLVLASTATATINQARCSRLTLNAVTLLNQGTLTLGASGGASDGPLWMENGAQLQNAGTFNDDSTEPSGCGYGHLPSIYQNAGTNSILNTGTFQSASSEEPVETNVPFTNQGTINVKTGTLRLPGNIANEKVVSLGAGTDLSVAGNYTQGENGTLKTTIGGESSFGRLSVGGTATLGGLLAIVPANGFSGELGQSFAIVSTASRTGTFAFVSGGAISPTLTYQPRYSLNGVTLAVTGNEGQEPVPTLSSPPTVSGGSPQQGQTLVVSHGSWKYSPTAYTEQWQRCDASGNNCVAIEGASGQTYTLGSTDVGHTIEVQETAHNAAGDSASARSAPTGVVSTLPLHAVAGENVKTVEDAEVSFDASGSTPSSEITRYNWEFGDGGSDQGVSVRHTYTTAGTYTATLTIKRGSEQQSRSITVTVTPKPEPSKVASITVLDSANHPVGEAEVLYVAPDGSRTEAATAADGVAALPALPEGSSVVYAYKNGFRPATGLVNVNSEHVGSTSVTLETGEVATSGLSSHELSLSEIEEAGINPSEPANQVVYEFEAKIGFPESEQKPIELHGYVNGSGQFVGPPPSTSTTLACSSTGCETQSEEGTRVIATPEIVEEHPIIQWLILHGKAAMVKQFFEVSMVVQNLSSEEPFSLSEGTATLNLPAGMSLAPTSQPQSLTQPVESIPPESSVTSSWVVRGDMPGQYVLSADYNATLEPFMTPVSLQAALAQPLQVWGANALSSALRVDRGAPERGIPYHVAIGVTNKSNIPLYNVSIDVDPERHEHFIFQPRQQYSGTIAEVPPGQTVFAPSAILVPDTRRETNPALQEISLAGETASEPGAVQDVAPPPLYKASAESGSSPVHLRWQQVPHAEGYEVFSTPTLETPFGSNPATVRLTPGGEAITKLPATASEAYVSGGTFFAISSIVEGHLVLDHPVLETLEAGEPEVPQKEQEEQFGTENEAQPHKPHCLRGHPVNCVTGNQVETQSDFSVGGRGAGLHMTRSYNSQMAAAQTQPGPLGFGWAGPYSARLTVDQLTSTVTVHETNGSVTSFALAEGAYWPIAPLVQATLVKEGSGFLYTLPDQTKLAFNSAGQLTRETDRNGNSVSLSYNGSGQLTNVTDPGARKMTLAYNHEGFVESATDPMGHAVKYGYEAGNLVSVTEPGEASPRWRFKYDSSHQLTSQTNALGHAVISEYDSSHRVISQTDPVGRKRTWSYLPAAEGSETRITEPNGAVTAEQFNAAGLPSSVTHAFGTSLAATSSYEYDKFGDLTVATDPLGHKISYGYDEAGNRTSETNGFANTTRWSYNAAHEVTSTTTPGGETTTTEREAHGNPVSVSHPDPGGTTAVTRYKYDAHGELESVTDPLNRVWHYEYDEAGDRVAETDPAGDKRTFSYDADSNVIATVSARGNAAGAQASAFTTKIERDAQEREIKTTNPLGDTTKDTYEAAGNIATSTDANAHVTSYTYDADNELTKTSEPAGTATETTYESAGQEASQTDADKHTTKYVHNLLGEVTEVIDPLGRASKREYNADGELTQLTDAAGRVTSDHYNGIGRLIEVSYSDGKTPTVKYEYDADGNRTKMLDGTGLSTYAYDQLDRLTEAVDGHGERTAHEYNLDNEQTKITYPNGKSVTRTFDNAGRLKSVTDWLGHTTTYSYDADSDAIATIFPASTGEEDTASFNEADQLTKTVIKKGSKTLVSLADAREKNGLLKSVTPKGIPGEAKTAYTYDANNRLTKAGTTGYEYDAAGNPLKVGTTANTYDEADQLKTGTGVSYTFNALGQRTQSAPTSGASTSYGYDQAGNLISVTRPHVGSTAAIEDSYTYDGNGLRASQTVSAHTAYLAWDGSESLPVLLGDSTNSYVYGSGGEPLEQISSTGGVLYFHHDQQGSTRVLTGETGAIEATFNYTPYGALSSSSGTASTPLGFDGQLTNADTGLIYLRARSYDPATGQFLSVDGGTEVTRSRYRYVGDDPLNGTDQSGMCGVNTESLGGFLGSVGEDVNPVSTENCFYQGTKGLLETVGVDPAVIATGAVIAGIGVSVFLDSTVVGAPLGAALGVLAASASAYQAGGEAGNGEYLASALDGIGSLLGGTAAAEHLLEGLNTLAGQFSQLGDLADRTAPSAKQLAEVFDDVAATSTVASDVLGRLHQVEREEAEGCTS